MEIVLTAVAVVFLLNAAALGLLVRLYLRELRHESTGAQVMELRTRQSAQDVGPGPHDSARWG